jgi:hypothetical protein
MVIEVLRQLKSIFVSLRLTVVLLALSIVLVFWATLDQVHLGVWAVQQKFFHSLFVMVNVAGQRFPVFPGGYLIGGLLLANLIAAHVYRMKTGWKKLGIWITHTGLILLLLGELVSGLVQQEFQMRLDNGETKNYAESIRRYELAVIDETDPATDDVVAIPESYLANGTVLQHPKLPFRVVPREYFPNAAIQMRSQAPNAPPTLATQGVGLEIAATPMEVTYKEDERNLPFAFVEFIGPEGSIGTFAVSPAPGFPVQRFEAGGRKWKIAFRSERHYQPFSITLEKFSHDVYPGTDIPKNFSSKVRLNLPDTGASREVLIYMNNPLRFGGMTYYQAGFEPNDQTTILQVVRNPSWLVPYIACAAITLGLVIQFLIHLAAFATRRRTA